MFVRRALLCRVRGLGVGGVSSLVRGVGAPVRAAFMVAIVPGGMACEVVPDGSTTAPSHEVFAQHGGVPHADECADLVNRRAKGLCQAYYNAGCHDDPNGTGCAEIAEEYEDLGQGPMPGTVTCWCDRDGDTYYTECPGDPACLVESETDPGSCPDSDDYNNEVGCV